MSTSADDPLVPRPADGRVFAAGRRVRLADASAGGRLRLDACARYLQDVANDDARDAATPNPTAWVARRTIIRVEHFPQYLDWLTLATWCSGLGPRWAERRYSMTGERGVVEAATLWVHVDMTTMKPVALPAGFEEQFGRAAKGRRVSARLSLGSRPPDCDVVTASWPLRFVDFDVLGHVNNTVYWAVVEEQLARRRDVRAPLTVELEHHDPIDPGDEVALEVVDCDGDGEAGFDLWVRTSTGKVCAVVRARSAVTLQSMS